MRSRAELLCLLPTILLGASCGPAPSTLPEHLEAAETWMYQIQGLDENDATEVLADTDYPLLVLEPGHNFSDFPYETEEMVDALRERPDGGKRLLLAYVDIGQAEDYRDYWEDDWRAPDHVDGPNPDFILAPDPNGWDGNFVVAYWDDAWKEMWVGDGGIVQYLAEAGFDGVYLDWVEAWDDERAWEAAEADDVEVAEEMMTFIEEIGDAGDAVTEGFLVVPQNSPFLIDEDPDWYAGIIDALACEDTWFYGEGDADWDDPDAGDLHGGNRHDGKWSTESRLEQYGEYKDRDIPVFTVDYCIDEGNADQVYEDSAGEDLRPLVTRVSLGRLTETPPP